MTESVPAHGAAPDGKSDSGWLADTSFEIGGIARGRIVRQATASWSTVADDRDLQLDLVQRQVKYAKNELFDHGYHLNQLIDEVLSLEVETQGELVEIRYAVTVDLLMGLEDDVLPELADLGPRDACSATTDSPCAVVNLPLDPVNVYARGGKACVRDMSATEYNYYYYYEPDRDGCELETEPVEIELGPVFGRPTVYPEYDRLLEHVFDDGTRGFRAAIVPARGDHNAYDRFDRFVAMIECNPAAEVCHHGGLALVGVDVLRESDGKRLLRRYQWRVGTVRIEIDLYDPVNAPLSATFHAALGEYQLLYYNGHSRYGTRDLLTNREAYSDAYQIVMMHSCRSYAYYVRQVFAAKATAGDPRGFAAADVVATGESSYPQHAAMTLEPLLRALMGGMSASVEGRPDDATDWLTIVGAMNTRVPLGILYGVAGVRDNRWQPGTVPVGEGTPPLPPVAVADGGLQVAGGDATVVDAGQVVAMPLPPDGGMP